MSIDERLAGMSDQELSRLHANAQRLGDSGSIPQRNEAQRLLPLIDAELAERRARAPARPPRKAPAKTAAKKSRAKAKATVDED